MLNLTPARHCARARAHIAGNEARRLDQRTRAERWDAVRKQLREVVG